MYYPYTTQTLNSLQTIYILSQPIQTGKTSKLLEWVKTQQGIGGILTPDIDGKRKLLDIANNQFHHLQLEPHEEGIPIGRFVFSKEVLAKARQILNDAITQPYQWIIVDEIGRLEMDEKQGLEPAVSEIISYYQSNRVEAKLLLVIRDYLLADAIQYYGLKEAKVLPLHFTQTHQLSHQLKGVVMCGGRSERMGKDKALMQYHNQPQYAHVAQLIQPFCDAVYLSCNAQQTELKSTNYPVIEDENIYANAGPMTGVLSAWKTFPQQALLAVGCDYPYLTLNDIKKLVDARQPDADAVCYMHPDSGFEEPLLAIYEPSCAGKILSAFQEGNTSLRFLLKQLNTIKILPDNPSTIQSVDTPLDRNI